MWYVIQVRSGTEERVVDGCKRQLCDGEAVFTPMLEMQRRVHGEEIVEQKPLFVGYVFFDTQDVEGLFFRLKRVSGFTKILQVDKEFIPITVEERDVIERLRDDENVVRMSEGYKEGDRVVITSGPLVGMESRIKKVNRAKRQAVLELSLMGEVREVTLGLRVLNKE